ncbi:hypothetical protein BLA24_32215 [Streptomyces cinnamoneus]|uniref:CBS domain-containing protein n=1 Tax=Streptomyces cinnamoneus TaxID=53446 RepID=A0A2G1XA66_STRCJ|nr:hypothetical protein [Streptomyces cinnamoneus]PHQ48105.1 hypothetical protein BLA24_32215 [Streptomyces cinnamoneus]PPT15731.1 hypothetical protein CYQ11_25270 [Streptomyces cinnamoneus]
MTPAQTRQRPPHPLTSAPAGAEAVDLSGPQVCDDMTVEVALAVMAGARVDFLSLCDRDDQVTGSITRTRLVAVRDSSAYTDRLRLRDVLGADGPPAPPAPTTTPGAGHPARCRQPGVPSAVAREHGSALDALTLSR